MMEMKNIIKKIASIAMAFTLLGTGTTVTKTISLKSDNTIVAVAAYCKHKCRSYTVEYKYLTKTGETKTIHGTKYSYKVQNMKYTKCSNCNTLLSDLPFGKETTFYSADYLGENKEVYGNWDKFRIKHEYPYDSQYLSTTPLNYNIVFEKVELSRNVQSENTQNLK